MEINNELKNTEQAVPTHNYPIDCNFRNYYGNYSNFLQYIKDVDLLISSTYETQHRNTYIDSNILPLIKSRNTMLDIGIGNGDLTKMLAVPFINLTIADVSPKALLSIPDRYGPRDMNVTKILSPVESLELRNNTFDFIVLSHTLYYIAPDERISVIDKLYNALNPAGSLLLIFNKGGTRSDMVKHFDGANFNFDQIYQHMSAFSSFLFKKIIEEIKTIDLCNMMSISGVCLKDGNTGASQEDLQSYVKEHFLLGDSSYTMTMEQNIILITHD